MILAESPPQHWTIDVVQFKVKGNHADIRCAIHGPSERLPQQRRWTHACRRARCRSRASSGKRGAVEESPCRSAANLRAEPVSCNGANCQLLSKGAAIAGSTGAELDPRLESSDSAKVIVKARPSAFSNPELEQYLRAHDVQELYVLGVFAEGCVRSTVVETVKLGYTVHIIANAVAANAAWKKRFALWAMKRVGAKIVPSLFATMPSSP